jgi:N-formylglutamate deformylase
MTLYSCIEAASPLILNFPHSGVYLPPRIASCLTQTARALPDTDWHVPRLYGFAQALDVSWMEARVSRYAIDLNRDPKGASLYPGQATTALCPLQGFSGAPLWKAGCEPDEQEITERKNRFFTPYHAALEAQIERVKAVHGFALLLDCHSICGTIPRLFDGALPTLNLGTHSGQSCAPALQSRIARILQQSPQTHIINGRFKGGWITRHYGKPQHAVHVLQMEIAQHAYMDEKPPFTWQGHKAVQLQETLKQIVTSLLEWRDPQG